MKIGIYGRPTSNNISAPVQQLFNAIASAGFQPVIYTPFLNYIQGHLQLPEQVHTFSSHAELVGKADVMISLGGDGTLLDTISFIRNSGIPILGVNTGRLGFLANVNKELVNDAVEALRQHNYSFEERSLLKIQSPEGLFGDVNYALNELTVLKKDSSAMMTIHTHLNGAFLNSYWADGLIISTPTGSTAYSLSCGGPLMMPEAEAFIITPIAPHNLNVRPLVVSSNSIISFKVEGRSPNYLLSLDSRTETVEAGQTITLQRNDFSIKLIRLANQDFLETMRNKLMWGLDRRN